MIDNELIEKLKLLKEQNGYTLYELSKKIDIQVSIIVFFSFVQVIVS